MSTKEAKRKAATLQRLVAKQLRATEMGWVADAVQAADGVCGTEEGMEVLLLRPVSEEDRAVICKHRTMVAEAIGCVLDPSREMIGLRIG